MRRHHILQSSKHVFNATRKLLFPIAQHLPHHLPLQAVLAAAQCARNDRELTIGGPTRQVFFGHISEWTNHHVVTTIAHQFGWHAFEFAAKEHVQKEGLQNVIAVVT